MQNKPITVIGYGSLMSGMGLCSSGPLHTLSAFPVLLQGCHRGFAKLSRWEDRFSMALEVTQPPLRAKRVCPQTDSGQGIEALALVLPYTDFSHIAEREGYREEALRRLCELARQEGRDLADFLWQILTEEAYNIVSYRRRLYSLVHYTSPHYIPHPLVLEGEGVVLTFLAPGTEGTGSWKVPSMRQSTGICSLMSMGETWRRKPNPFQLAYFLSCLLSGVHGLRVHDFLPLPQDDPVLYQSLKERLSKEIPLERERFLRVTGLSEALYQKNFTSGEKALKRSGLKSLL